MRQGAFRVEKIKESFSIGIQPLQADPDKETPRRVPWYVDLWNRPAKVNGALLRSMWRRDKCSIKGWISQNIRKKFRWLEWNTGIGLAASGGGNSITAYRHRKNVAACQETIIIRALRYCIKIPQFGEERLYKNRYRWKWAIWMICTCSWWICLTGHGVMVIERILLQGFKS